jgi:TfdA family taurine catabolism dioxygenase TauD
MSQFSAQAATYFKRPHVKIPAQPVSHPAAWYGADMVAQAEQWRIPFTAAEISELESVGQRLLDQKLSLELISKSNFEVPRVGEKLQRVAQEVHTGRGFCVLRGLPVQQWGEALTSIIYWGMGHHLGKPGVQNPQGEKLGHVKDYREGGAQSMQRLYRTASNIGFHCDGAQAVGLLCLNTAKSGGASRIASSVTVFNELLETDPDLAKRLFEPVYMDRRNEQPVGEPPCTPIQPCCFEPPNLRTFYHSEYYRSAVRHPGYEPDERTQKLLDRYDEIANSARVFLDMWLQPGDIQLISNYTVIHARTAYEDFDDPQKKRHLLRLWLNFDT